MSEATRGKRKKVSPPLKSGLDRKRTRLYLPRKAKSGKRGIQTCPELPEELIRAEILARLPIKSVVRFKSVCKSWLSVFSDPRFVKQHSDYQNPEDNDFLVGNKSGHIVILSRYEEKLARRNACYCLIGSAKGLVCLQREEILSLWNPAIHQSKEFRLPPLGYGCLDRVGLGYDPVSNDYRVGICYCSLDKSRLCYAVYSSGSDSWTHFQFDDPDHEILVSKFKDCVTPTTVVKDSPYWTICSTTILMSNKDKVILSLDALKFDATSNKFKLLPNFSSEFSKDKTFTVVNMKDLLSFMAYEPCPVRKLEVYSLDEDKGCGGGGVWSKMYSFGPFVQFRRFENLLQGFKYGDEIVINEWGKIYRFNHKMGTFDRIPGIDTAGEREYFTYTPSLVSLQGMTSIYSENQTPLLGHHSTTSLRLEDSIGGRLVRSVVWRCD